MTRRRARKSKPKQNRANKPRKRGHAPGVLGSLGGAVGTYLAGGHPLGALLGKRAGDWLGKITGMGDYKVNRNTLLTGAVPRFNSDKEFTLITHREYLGDVVSGTAGTFDIQEYTVNPSNESTFPWLSNIAQQYESYEITGMIFEFKSLSGTAVGSTNTALGAVTMATVYDVEAPPFASRREMEQYEYSVSARTTENLIHPIECDPSQNVLPMLFTRNATGANVRDKRFHDMANFYIATDGLQASNVTVGELWVSYRVKLFKPRHRTGVTSIFRCGCLDVPTGTSFNAAMYAEDPLMSQAVVEFPSATQVRLRGPGIWMVVANACVDSGVSTIGLSADWALSTGATNPSAGWYPRDLGGPTSSNTAGFVDSTQTHAESARLVEILGADGLVTLPIFSVAVAPQTYNVVFTFQRLNTYTDTVSYSYAPYPFPALMMTQAEKDLKSAKTRILELTSQLEILNDFSDCKVR